MSSELIEVSLSGNRNNLFRGNDPIASAALGVQEAEKVLERAGVRAIPQERALAAHSDEAFVFEFVEVMRQCGVGNVQLGLDLADDEALRLGGHQELHDAKACFGAHGRE